MNVLIVEDDIVFASQLSQTFSKSWFANRLEHIISNEEFLSARESISSYDLILLDISLWTHNQRGWFDILMHIRKINEKIPIIIISSHNEYDFLEEAFTLGANDYVIKPFRNRELQIRIQRWYRNYLFSEYFSITNVIKYKEISYHISPNIFYYNNSKIILSRWNKYLLSLLLIHKEKTLWHSFLIEKIWWYTEKNLSNNLRIRIMRLKYQLKKYELDTWIQTIIWEGYMLKKD